MIWTSSNLSISLSIRPRELAFARLFFVFVFFWISRQRFRGCLSLPICALNTILLEAHQPQSVGCYRWEVKRRFQLLCYWLRPPSGQARPSVNPTRNERRSLPTVKVSPWVCVGLHPGVAAYPIIESGFDISGVNGTILRYNLINITRTSQCLSMRIKFVIQWATFDSVV